MNSISTNKKQVVLNYALENHFSDWLIKEIRNSNDDSRPIRFCYKKIQDGKLYENSANDAFFYLD